MLSLLRQHMKNGDLCKEILYRGDTDVVIWDDIRVTLWRRFCAMVDISSDGGRDHFDHYTQVPKDVYEYISSQFSKEKIA